MQVARRRRIARFKRAIGCQDELGQRTAIGRAGAVEAAHHWTEEREVGSAEQADASADPVGDLIDRGRRQVTLLDADDSADIGELFQRLWR